MFFYEITCSVCRKKFKVYEGSEEYKNYKINRNTKQHCEICKHKLELEARILFFKK